MLPIYSEVVKLNVYVEPVEADEQTYTPSTCVA